MRNKCLSLWIEEFTFIDFPHIILPFAIWMAKAASSCVRYLTNPNPLSLCIRTSSITPAPKIWNWRWSSTCDTWDVHCQMNGMRTKSKTQQTVWQCGLKRKRGATKVLVRDIKIYKFNELPHGPGYQHTQLCMQDYFQGPFHLNSPGLHLLQTNNTMLTFFKLCSISACLYIICFRR